MKDHDNLTVSDAELVSLEERCLAGRVDLVTKFEHTKGFDLSDFNGFLGLSTSAIVL
jgi:hypothetical protein